MEVNEEMINRLARLSRLRFSETELPQIRADLEKMIHFVEKLKELDLDAVEPLMHVTEAQDVFREDEPGEPLPSADVFKNATVQDGRYFKVPKIFNKEKR